MPAQVMLAIDFGDQLTKVAIANPPQPGQKGLEETDITFLHPTLPSLLALGEDHTIKIGLDAQALREVAIYTIVNSFKRFGGSVIGDRGPAPATVQVSDEHDTSKSKINHDAALLSIQHTAIFLFSIVRLVSSISHRSVSKAIITVPSWFTIAQRENLVCASKMAGLAHVGFMTEAAASLLDYALSHRDLLSLGDQHIVLVDIGHAGSTVTVATLGNNKAKIKSTDSVATFGGYVIDQVLLDYLEGKIRSTDQLTIFGDLKASGKLLADCQRIKEAVCLSEETSQAFYFSAPFEQVSITGKELEHLIGPVHLISALVLKSLASAGITSDQVYELVLLGGSTRLFAIKKCVTQVFPWGISVNLALPTAAARGAIYACNSFEEPGYFDFDNEALSYLLSGQGKLPFLKQPTGQSLELATIEYMSKLDCSSLAEQYEFVESPYLVENTLLQASSTAPQLVSNEVQVLPSNNVTEEISALQQTLDSMPDNHPEKCLLLNKLTTLLLVRVAATPTTEDLILALSTQTKAVALAPVMADKAQYLNSIAMMIKQSIAIMPNMGMLNQGIFGLQMAVTLAGGDDKNQAKYLNNLSHLIHLRYQNGFNIEDLDLAIATQKRALDLIPDSEETKSTFLQIYGLMLESRFDKQSDISDLKEAVSILEKAVKLASPADGQKSAYFFNFGIVLKKLFDQLGNISDLENSILYENLAVNLAPDADIQKPMFCHHLGQLLQARFLQTWKLEDLDNAIKNCQYAVKLVNDSHESKPVYLNHLGEIFGMYFIHQKSAPYIDHAILFQRRALELTPLRNRALYLRNLAFLLETRFYSPTRSTAQDLEEAITCRQQALVLTPYFLPEKQKQLTDLVASLHASYKHNHNLEALAEAISTQREVIQLSSETENQDQEKHAKYMFDLGRLLQATFEENSNIRDLEEAIIQLKKSTIDTNNCSSKAQYLSHLGAALCTRFEQLHDLTDLEASIVFAKQAVDLAADDDLDKPSYINNFAKAMVLHFENFRNTESLNIAVKSYQTIVEETSNDHPHKAIRLNNLGVTQLKLFKHEGRIADLHKAIVTSKEAVNQVVIDDLNKFPYLGNLANALQAQWQHIGDNIDVLDQAISIQQKIIDKIPDGHLDKAGYLNNLGNSLLSCYEALGEIFDLTNGLFYQLKAVEATPLPHPQRPLYLNNLGNSFRKRFARHLSLKDLKSAIDLYQEAIDLAPNNHVNRGLYLYNLGLAFSTNFESSNLIQDLKASIVHQEASLQITSLKDPSRMMKLATLGNSLRQQANYWKDLPGLENALVLLQDALLLMADDHPERIKILLIQGQTFEDIFEMNGDHSTLQKSLENYKQAAQLQSGSPPNQFAATLRWIAYALKYDTSSCMEAYTCALKLLPHLAWLGLSIEAQFERLYSAQSLVSDAVATALNFGFVDLALEWLESGRSVVWNQILQLKQPLQHLKEINPSLAEKIDKLSKEYSHHQAHHAFYFADKGLQEASSYEKSIGIQHRLAKSWEALLQEVEEIPEFKHTFAKKSSSMLKEAASQGPVVVLNASKLQCDAIIIISPSLPLVHLPLHQTSYEKIHNLQQEIFSLLTSDLRLRNELDNTNDRYGGPAMRYIPTADDVFQYVLEELWNTVVKPVLDLLQLNSQSITAGIPHIWWCPTSQFTFLPIHAAGIYGGLGITTVTLADYAVSSYTPSLSGLLSAREQACETKSPGFLAVAQADTPDQSPLPGVVHELALLKECVPLPLKVIGGSEATVQNVLEALRNFSWVHFSCHGKQDMDIPTLSGLHLHDGVLSLRHIIHESLPNAEFAFLSACQTASGDYFQPDETLHLAGGMMLAGFRSVIATMWSVGDQDAPVITEEVYKHLFQDKIKEPNGLESAVSLHIAVQKLRHQYQNKSFASWVPFIHMGL